ncbi:hypothetical protein [Rufibacter hautae]|uniref:hypothetical protein n=1 Tax=Rufibacter hautae TaxID=2595005 RepID=UPI001680C740|nr:hypothetical protein [Rufibacter hautae]
MSSLDSLGFPILQHLHRKIKTKETKTVLSGLKVVVQFSAAVITSRNRMWMA